MKTVFLSISVMLTIYSAIPYIRDILKGTTKPNLVSWITWSLLTGVATAAAISAHEYVAAIFTGAATLETALVVLLGLRHGYVRYSQFDVVCQMAAVVGIILWQLFDSPAIGVIGAVVIDLVGALPTAVHSWNKPEEETWSTYALAAVGGAFALLALDTFNWVTLPYAMYIVAINGVFVYIILTQRRNDTG